VVVCKQEAEQKEERAEGVGAATDPGYSLGVDGEGQPEKSCCCGDNQGDAEKAQEAVSQKAVGDVEKKIGEVEAGWVELPEAAVECKGNPVEGAVREAPGSAKVSGEGYRREQETMSEGVPRCEGWIVDDLVKVVVKEGCADSVPIEREDP
jgi:hypothetical protein